MRILKKVLWLGAIFLFNVPDTAAWSPFQDGQQKLGINESDTVKVVGAVEELLSDLPELQEFGSGSRVSEDLLKSRFAKLQKSIPLVYNQSSHDFVEFFIYRRENFTRTMMELMPLYFPLFEKALQRHGLPTELKYLSMIESGLNPRAISRAKAGGLWQFMPATGREFGLKQDGIVDERFDPVKATEAACRYMKQLYRIFGDWELALASYNTGPGNVKRAMRRSQGETFWTIYNVLPKETRSYVPQYVAINYMMNYGHDHGITPNKMEYEIPHDTIQVNGYMNLVTFCESSGIDRVELEKLNPHIIKNILPESTRDFVLKVPSVRYTYFLANRDVIMDSCTRKYTGVTMIAKVDSTQKDSLGNYLVVLVPRPRMEDEDDQLDNVVTKKVSHLVKRGENIKGISSKFKVSMSDIKKWNKLKSNSLRSGQRLVIYQSVKQPVRTERVAIVKSKEVPAVSKEEDTSVATVVSEKRTYIVQKGENLQGIARKLGVEIADLKNWNSLRNNTILKGQKLVAYKKVKTTVQSEPVQLAKADIVTKETAIVANKTEAVETVVAEKEISTVSGQVLSKKEYHTVSKGENLQIIARKYGVKISELQEWNNLSTTRLNIGQNLIVHLIHAEKSDEVVQVAAEKEKEKQELVVKKQVPEKLHYYTVQHGDTLWTISQRYGLDLNSLKKRNNIKGNAIKPGQKLIITT
jgi:membrane-bound lytic murein transglycosylase D